MRKDIAVGLWFAGFAGTVLAGSWETTSLRAPGGGLVSIGMTRQEVIRELGEQRQAEGTKGKSSTRSGRWVYRGADGVYTLTFSGDRLSRIDVTPNR